MQHRRRRRAPATSYVLAALSCCAASCASPSESKGCGLKTTKHQALLGQTTQQLGFKQFGDGENERLWNIYVPSSYDPKVPMPLVLNFHGFTSNANVSESDSGLSVVAEREGFIVVYGRLGSSRAV